MYEIPKPELLNPDRVDRDDRANLTAADHRTRAQLLAQALGESCAYADQLWEQVNALRGYLLDSLPPDPRVPGRHGAGASPTGPDDEDGWRDWINAFATTTSVLCGAHGDSGFGLSRAREEAQRRRTAPELTVAARLGRDALPDAVAGDSGTEQAGPAVPQRETPPSVLRMAAYAGLAVLAVRGLRPGASGGRASRPAAGAP